VRWSADLSRSSAADGSDHGADLSSRERESPDHIDAHYGKRCVKHGEGSPRRLPPPVAKSTGALCIGTLPAAGSGHRPRPGAEQVVSGPFTPPIASPNQSKNKYLGREGAL